MHFGRLLAKLRAERGLTQERLAELSGLSTPSIQRGEASAKCPFRRSNANDVFLALERAAPLSPNDAENYLQLAGLEVLARHARQHQEEMQAIGKRSIEGIANSPFNYSTIDDPDATTAHNWVWRLLEEAGPTRVLAAIEALAAAWNIDLQPRLRADDKARRPAWAMFTEYVDRDTGVRVQLHDPIPSPRPPALPVKTPKAQRRPSA